MAKGSGARLVIVNAEPTPFDDLADVVLRDPIGQVMSSICADAIMEAGRFADR
jgi:NAD-dependent protein deacetylase/lipoamidase